MVTRRSVLLGGAGLLALMGGTRAGYAAPKAAPRAGTFEVTMTDAEWRARLGDKAWRVLRHEGTEPAFSSPLDREKRAGAFHCAGCDLPLFSSTTKFDSGTGWPSFWKPLPDAVRTREDRSFGWVRTEVHCRRISATSSTTAPRRQACAIA